MKIIRPTCKACQSLAKAIDAYIAKVNDGLADEMSDAGYADAKDSVNGADQLEEDVKDILTTQTEELADVIEEAGTIPKAKKAVEQYFEDDVTGEELTETFIDYFSETVTDLSSSYMKMTEEDLDVTQLRKRTTAWINQWSSQLSQIMQLTSQQQIGSLLQNALDSGKGCDVFAQELIKNGIRKEAWRARATAVTEMLRAHSVARQEAIIQSPATDRKKWRHSGGHKNDPRENHVDMDGQIVPKAEPFVLIGRKGGTHYPMFPRDPELPPEESINCHCTHVPVANDDILGLSYEERKQMQQEIIAADDGMWEKELDSIWNNADDSNSSITVTSDLSYMMDKFKPDYGEKQSLTVRNKEETKTVQAYKIKNSTIDMYAESSVSKKNLTIRIAEKYMPDVLKTLPEDMVPPKILICDFRKVGLSKTAIGAYDRENNLMLFNARYHSKKAFRNYVTKKPGWFANTDIISPFLHETGHAFHDYLIKRVASMRGVEYTEAKRLFDSRVRTALKNLGFPYNDVIKSQLSEYSDYYYGTHRMDENVNEIMSEWYTVKDGDSRSPFVEQISQIVDEVMSDDGLQ